MSSSAVVYDVIVVGAGIEGSSSAYALVKSGKKVLLLEQFPLPHSRGSSHGQSRVTRYAYAEEFYVRMMVDAFPLWDQLQKESKTDFFINCGVLDLRTENAPGVKSVSDALRKYNVPFEVLSPRQLQRQYPQITAGKNVGAIWDPSGGLLRADRALAAFQKVFRDLGGILHDNEPVTSISPGDVVTVGTTRSVYTARDLVICAGPWTGPITASLGLQLPLKTVLATVYYWRMAEGRTDGFAPQKFPCFIDSSKDGNYDVYGLPESEYPGLVKVCISDGPACDPNRRDQAGSDKWVEERVRNSIVSTFPDLEPTPSVREYCMFTMTPDLHPFIDCHPKYPNVVIAGGFSAHGFKLAPAVGKAVSELVLKKQLTYNMQPFRLTRFSPQANL